MCENAGLCARADGSVAPTAICPESYSPTNLPVANRLTSTRLFFCGYSGLELFSLYRKKSQGCVAAIRERIYGDKKARPDAVSLGRPMVHSPFESASSWTTMISSPIEMV